MLNNLDYEWYMHVMYVPYKKIVVSVAALIPRWRGVTIKKAVLHVGPPHLMT